MEQRIFEKVKYEFKPDEVRELGEALARETQVTLDLKDQKASVTATLTGKIKEAEVRIADLTNKINSGFEFRDVECMILLEKPRPGLKTIIRTDTNQEHRVEAMTAAEMQQGFGFTDPDEK